VQENLTELLFLLTNDAAREIWGQFPSPHHTYVARNHTDTELLISYDEQRSKGDLGQFPSP